MKNDTKELLEYMIKEESCELVYSEIKEYFKELKDQLESECDFVFEFEGVDHRIIHENAIDEIWIDSLIEQIKECYSLDEIPSFIKIDWDATAEACKIDGLGNHFNWYDGGEHKTENWYIFRLGA